jgi:hypothetical protein
MDPLAPPDRPHGHTRSAPRRAPRRVSLGGKSMGRAAEMHIELTGYDRPACLAERTTIRQADIDGTLHLSPCLTERMHWSWHVRPKGPSKLLAPMINWMGKRQERTVWAAMKRYLQAPQPKRNCHPRSFRGRVPPPVGADSIQLAPQPPVSLLLPGCPGRAPRRRPAPAARSPRRQRRGSYATGR